MNLSRKASHGQDSSYFLGLQEYDRNPYDDVRNPDGIIQMGLAENQLCFDLLETWLAENPDAASFKTNGQSIFKELALFQDYHGLPSFKNALVQFMEEIRGNKVSFDPKNLVLTAGSTSANEALIFCLANPGDAFLLPTPYYPGFDRDLKWRTEVEIVPIQCTSSNGFRITKPAIEEAFLSAQNKNLKVKGILVTNPSNPLGITLNIKEMKILVDFIHIKGIHLISDEIYSGTVFDSPSFVSVVEAVHQNPNYTNNKDRILNRVHIVYSLSKDLGLPGFRVGAIYSNDPVVVAAATKMSSFGLVSSQTQYLLSAMLSDKKFAKDYLMENQKRLKNRHEMLVRGLENAGISCLTSNAGLFSWVDMRHLLNKKSFQSEMDLWNKMVYEVGLNISPGSSCHCVEPGWFRFCFANMSEETLNLAMTRIKLFVEDIPLKQKHNKNSGFSIKKPRNKLGKWSFLLSTNDRERER